MSLNIKCAFLIISGKIEVKILTRKNAEEAGDQWLTEEDTKSFRELLINLLVIKVTLFWNNLDTSVNLVGK